MNEEDNKEKEPIMCGDRLIWIIDVDSYRRSFTRYFCNECASLFVGTFIPTSGRLN